MSLLFIISLLITSCASNSINGINLLEMLGDYDKKDEASSTAKSLKKVSFQPKRTTPLVKDIYVHPHELPSGDYFNGGWIRVIVQESIWK